MECVTTLREWALRESEFQVIASETVRGVGSTTSQSQKSYVTLHTDSCKKSEGRNLAVCKLCRQRHHISNCSMLETMSVNERWDIAKAHRLCYRCLAYGHVGYRCKNSARCGIDGCKSTYNKLLHEDRNHKHHVSNMINHRNTADVSL